LINFVDRSQRANHYARPPTTDSVLCTVEDHVILHSLRNTTIAPPWQFRL